MSLRILYQDEELVAIDKPAGFHVHPPEDSQHKISPSVNCLHILGEQLGTYLYPVHRLDRATSGVLVFALQKNMARLLCELFQAHQMKKVYFCVVRGWTQDEGIIRLPLRSERDPEIKMDAVTFYQCLRQIEIPMAVGRYSTCRYSLLKVEPQSGRRHQIRRHLEHIAHPLIGDTVYGRGEHNRFFRENFQLAGLLLKAYSLEFLHPKTKTQIRLVSRWGGQWHRVFDLFGVCPFDSNV